MYVDSKVPNSRVSCCYPANPEIRVELPAISLPRFISIQIKKKKRKTHNEKLSNTIKHEKLEFLHRKFCFSCFFFLFHRSVSGHILRQKSKKEGKNKKTKSRRSESGTILEKVMNITIPLWGSRNFDCLEQDMFILLSGTLLSNSKLTFPNTRFSINARNGEIILIIYETFRPTYLTYTLHGENLSGKFLVFINWRNHTALFDWDILIYRWKYLKVMRIYIDMQGWKS